MSADRIITPPPHALACANCTAWHAWDSITIGQDGPRGFVIIGRKPTGQCRAAPPSIDPEAIGSETAIWPVIRADDWCRRFEMRDRQGEAA